MGEKVLVQLLNILEFAWGRYNIIFGTKKKSGAFNKSYISLDDGTNIINILTESQ